MADSTRIEAITWWRGLTTQAPVFPPPEGWAWNDPESGARLNLFVLMTSTVGDDDRDITLADVWPGVTVDREYFETGTEKAGE